MKLPYWVVRNIVQHHLTEMQRLLAVDTVRQGTQLLSQLVNTIAPQCGVAIFSVVTSVCY